MDFLRGIYYGSRIKMAKMMETPENRLAQKKESEETERRRQEITGAFRKVIETTQQVKANQSVTEKEKRTLQLLLMGYVRGVSRTTGGEFVGFIEDLNSRDPKTGQQSLASQMVEALRLTRQIPGFEKLVDESFVSLCSEYDSTYRDQSGRINPVTEPYYNPRRPSEATWVGEGTVARRTYVAERNYLG